MVLYKFKGSTVIQNKPKLRFFRLFLLKTSIGTFCFSCFCFILPVFSVRLIWTTNFFYYLYQRGLLVRMDKVLNSCMSKSIFTTTPDLRIHSNVRKLLISLWICQYSKTKRNTAPPPLVTTNNRFGVSRVIFDDLLTYVKINLFFIKIP